MASRLRALSASSAPPANKAAGAAPTFEEVFVRNDVVSLCLLLNRRARTMRVIDFRAGSSPAKKLFVQSIAQRERIEKVVVLVERDECATWGRLGFTREGNIPGFYKRSDAFLMGCIVPPPGAQAGHRTGDSGVFSVGRHASLTEAAEELVEDDAPTPAASALAEKTVAHARKIAKELVGSALPVVKIASLGAVDAQKRVAAATKETRALTGFESFGRDVQRDDVVVTAARAGEVVIGAEIQTCYDNAFVELLTGPRDDKERAFHIAALGAACDRLTAREIVSAFSITPADDVRLATVFVANGFRRTGLLRQHLRLRGERRDAILWSRKLANPHDEE
jgi:hypothetical protein